MIYTDYKVKNYTNIKEMCNKAKENKYAVPQFNINNLEWTKSILEVCQELQSPVILGISEGAAKYIGGYETACNMIVGLMKDLNITVPVAAHLDHGSSLEVAKKAIMDGCGSVMIDNSKYPIKENCSTTQKVVNLAKKYNVSVEAEVGLVGGEEDGHYNKQSVYAKIEDVLAIKSIGIDVLAATYGSVHGKYIDEPKIGFSNMEKAREKSHLPLVLHGGSGLSDEIIKKAIQNGICKINVNTENQEAYCKGVKEYFANGMDLKDKGYDPRKINKAGIDVMKEALIHKIKLFGSEGKG